MTVRRLNFLIEGRVQGVGYRRWAAGKALSLGLAGWVRNLPSGAVEVQAQGDPEALKKLEAFLGEGPAAARVSRVTAVEKPPEQKGGEGPFSIRHF